MSDARHQNIFETWFSVFSIQTPMKLRFTIRWMKMVKIYFQGSSQ